MQVSIARRIRVLPGEGGGGGGADMTRTVTQALLGEKALRMMRRILRRPGGYTYMYIPMYVYMNMH